MRIWGCEDVVDDLVYWNAHNSHFPSLENLVLEGFSGLDGLPSIYCSVSSAISTVRMPVEQEGQGNEDLQLELSILDAEEKEESFNKKVKKQCIQLGQW